MPNNSSLGPKNINQGIVYQGQGQPSPSFSNSSQKVFNNKNYRIINLVIKLAISSSSTNILTAIIVLISDMNNKILIFLLLKVNRDSLQRIN